MTKRPPAVLLNTTLATTTGFRRRAQISAMTFLVFFQRVSINVNSIMWTIATRMELLNYVPCVGRPACNALRNIRISSRVTEAGQPALIPPSITRLWPFIKREASLARNNAA